jgi:hypothetical protein
VRQSAAQAAAFFREVVRDGVVWTMRDSGGLPAPMTRDGQRAIPFWSRKSRVLRVIESVPVYAGFEPEQISLEEWRTEWLAGLRRDNMLAGVNWSGPEAAGMDLEPSVVLTRLEAAEHERVTGSSRANVS